MPPSLSVYGVRRGSVPDLPRQRPKPCAVAGTTSRPSPRRAEPAAGHPTARSNPYVFEHILVAEEILGRDLLPDETRPKPSGIRVSDAVVWARENSQPLGGQISSGVDIPGRSPARDRNSSVSMPAGSRARLYPEVGYLGRATWQRGRLADAQVTEIGANSRPQPTSPVSRK
jgi:hypothetical protein